MGRNLAHRGVFFVLISIVLCGCGHARYVTLDANGGVVAIPTNTDEWPCHYRVKAEEMMKMKCPQGYVIEREEEVVVGTTRQTDTHTDTTGHPLLAALQVAPITEKTQETTSYHDQSEWRIWFRAK